MNVVNKLSELNIQLPEAPDPVGAYVAFKRSGNYIYISGQLPIDKDGKIIKGKIGKDLTVEKGQEAAKLCVLNILAQAKKAMKGDLDKIKSCVKITAFVNSTEDFKDFDPMISEKYNRLNQESFSIQVTPEAILNIENISAYNQKEGLALSEDEVEYLEGVSKKIGRPLTDSEVFGFSQVNSEHCRHKIFNGTFIIDGGGVDKITAKTNNHLSLKNILK